MSDIAVVHQAALERGGGLRVAEEIAEYLDAPLYIGITNDDVVSRVPDSLDVRPMYNTILTREFSENAQFRRLYSLLKFRNSPTLRQYDTLVLSGANLQWYLPKPDQHIVVYRHSLKYPYTPEGSETLRWAYAVAKHPTLDYPDQYLANSDLTQSQLGKRLNIDATVVYPPLATNEYYNGSDKRYYLTITRITEGKRVDDLVEQFAEIDHQLKIAGDGLLIQELRKRAPPNVELLGYVSENKKRKLLSECTAFINHSGEENFGIAAAEALASGKAVLMAEGGYNHVREGKNGYTYEAGNLSDAVVRFESDGVSWSSAEIQEFTADTYGLERFEQQIDEAVYP